jgi:hypothetical protein
MIPFFQGAAGGAPVVSQVFATTLYTGNDVTRSFVNGVNLSGGGLVWVKSRTSADDHTLFDSGRGGDKYLVTNKTDAESTFSYLTFNSNGFSFTQNGAFSQLNSSLRTYVAWSFARAARFFDVVTYTGTGSARTVAHGLGTTPGMIIVKRRDSSDNWAVYHRGNTGTPKDNALLLNLADATADNNTYWNDTAPTSSEFTLGDNTAVNASGGTYVAYLFAHDTASDGIVQCGSYTGNGATGQTITLGWEPQFLLSKSTLNIDPWRLQDFARGFSTGSSNGVEIRPSESNAEFTGLNAPRPSATGFYVDNSTTGWNTLTEVYAYLAIRKP